MCRTSYLVGKLKRKSSLRNVGGPSRVHQGSCEGGEGNWLAVNSETDVIWKVKKTQEEAWDSTGKKGEAGASPSVTTEKPS